MAEWSTYARGRYNLRRFACAMLCLCVFACAIGTLAFSKGSGEGPSPRGISIDVASKPYQLRPAKEPIFAADSEIAALLIKLCARPPFDAADGPSLCHFLLGYGLAPIPVSDLQSGENIVRALTDTDYGRASFGQSLLVKTRYGVRYKLLTENRPRSQQGESHRDLFLASFAQVGVPLSASLHVNGETFALHDVLADSFATFDLDARELAWTAIAYAIYLPPIRDWCNRDGHSFSFDDLADRLMRTSLSESSCGGTHILMALTAILRRDEDANILSPRARDEVRGFLQKLVKTAEDAQAADGSWTLGWHSKSAIQPALLKSPMYKMTVTGHLLEWLTFLPKECQPNPSVYANASLWLARVLTVRATPATELCSWIHSINALHHLTRNSGPPEPHSITEVTASLPPLLDGYEVSGKRSLQ